jgi:diguanylate cyclase (GGDEF)-like protein
MPTSAATSSPELVQAITEARTVADVRHQSDADISAVDRWSAAIIGGLFTLVAVVLVALHGAPTASECWTFALLIAAHTIASKVVFESAGGSAVATEPILIAGLLLLPVEYVPVVVLLSLVLSASEGSRSRHDLLVRAVSGWHCIGPVAVLAAADPDGFALHHWPVYLVAVLAQFLLDALIAVVRCSALGISLTVLPRPMAWAWGVDALLAPIGVAAVLATDGSRWTLVFAMCPVGILAMLGRDRTEHFEKAVVISEAFEAALESARLDPVSGIANRRAWNEATARAALRFAANPMGRSVSVLLADVDGLKLVNDTLGHDAGDDLIRAAASALQAAAPTGALVARIGGDEFGILVTDRTDIDPDSLIARVRAAIGAHPPVHGVALSLSVGSAACPPYADVEAAQAAADERAIADKALRRAGR